LRFSPHQDRAFPRAGRGGQEREEREERGERGERRIEEECE
jgi:hypothetical protein